MLVLRADASQPTTRSAEVVLLLSEQDKRMCCKYGFQVDCSRCDIAERPVNEGFQIKQIGVVLFE
jgi:hypothetical protein